MKKVLPVILASVMTVSSLSGFFLKKSELTTAQTSTEHVTKYVINTDKLDIREKPSNESSIICSIDKGAPVSVIAESLNGYSEVMYDGVTGYALSSYLTRQEPKPETESESETAVKSESEPKSEPAKEVDVNVNIVQSNDSANSTPADQPQVNTYDSILSNRSDSEIENYIVSYVRPLYNEVKSNLNSYTASSANGVKYWHDGKGYIRKEFPASVNNYGLIREYYYDTDSGRIAFAFIHNGTTEYRLYFRENQLVRFIPPNGNVINNPRSDEALSMGRYVLSEAY